ncbi:MAG: type II secretion system F family protein, partial [Candidatus Eremiobacterota bacterium]
MSIPVLNSLLEHTALARVCTSMGALLCVGVGLLPAFKLACQASGNPMVEKEGDRIVEDLKAGIPLSESLMRSPFFPPTMTNMVAAGEESGRLDQMCDKLGSFYEEEVNYRLDALSTVLEPLLLAVVAVMVGLGLVSIFLPLYGYLGKLS